MNFLKLASFSLLAGGAMGQPDSLFEMGELQCESVKTCVQFEQTCDTTTGMVQVCITSLTESENSICDDRYSHINIYGDGVFQPGLAGSATPQTFVQTCDAEVGTGNHPCNDYEAQGVKWDSDPDADPDTDTGPDPRETTYCAYVPGGTDLTFGFKKGSKCNINGVGATWKCDKDCSCNGGGGQPTCSTTDEAIPCAIETDPCDPETCPYGPPRTATNPPDCNVFDVECTPAPSCDPETCPYGPPRTATNPPDCNIFDVECQEDPGGPGGPGVEGDPHFKTWNGTWYDYMGACDLVLLDAPNFSSEVSLVVAVRTTGRYEYSYVESTAIQIGLDVLEVGSFGTYFLNGVEGTRLPKQMADKYPVSHKPVNKKQHRFIIGLGDKEELVVETFKDLVSVNLNSIHDERFRGSLGMLGDYETGKTMTRNGTVEITDSELLAAEWQVRPQEDGMMFQAARAPQYPQPCQAASAKKSNLRSFFGLGHTVSEEDAKNSCGHLSGFQMKACVHDVVAIGDLELAATF